MRVDTTGAKCDNLLTVVDISRTPYCYHSSIESRIAALAERVTALRSNGRLSPGVLRRLREVFRIRNIYHSNAIEGNHLDAGETRQVVEHGLTLTGRSLRDQAEARNLSEALDLLEELAKDTSRPIRQHDVRQIHKLVLNGIDNDNAGRYRTVEVKISGSDYPPPAPESVSSKMEEYGDWLATASLPEESEDPGTGIIHAAVAHTWFVMTHPFIDGNGRVARLLMNLMLMRFGCPIAIITKKDRARYYDSLEVSQGSDLTAFLSLLIESIEESLDAYEDAVAQQREEEEWVAKLAERANAPEVVRASNEYEVWKSAMELLRNYFREIASGLDDAFLGRVYFKDFEMIEMEKYLALRSGGRAQRTWFCRVDFVQNERSARYLLFFQSASRALRNRCSITLCIAREEPAGSYDYPRLDAIQASNTPTLREIGYDHRREIFVSRHASDHVADEKIERIGRKFFEDIMNRHFDS